jgi:hypothetical protein
VKARRTRPHGRTAPGAGYGDAREFTINKVWRYTLRARTITTADAGAKKGAPRTVEELIPLTVPEVRRLLAQLI